MLWLEGILLVTMAAVLGAETLLPVFASRSWHTGSAGYGLLRIAPGIGAVLAGLGLSLFPPAGRRLPVLAAAFAAAGQPCSLRRQAVLHRRLHPARWDRGAWPQPR